MQIDRKKTQVTHPMLPTCPGGGPATGWFMMGWLAGGAKLPIGWSYIFATPDQR